MKHLQLASNLEQLRESQGLSLAQLGQRVGVAREQIWCYEHGEKMPSVQTLVMLADVLEVTVDALLFGPANKGATA
jgi:transcriptional regulator with XRE-family HTH domain